MRTGNPFLRESSFGSRQSFSGELMTANGTVNKAAFLIVIVFAAGVFGWSITGSSYGIGFLAMLGGLVFALITSFKPNVAPITSPIYAILQGIFLGSLCKVLEASYPGIARQAVIGTVTIFMVMMFLYRSGIIKVTDKLRSIVIACTIGIALAYFISFIMSFFTSSTLFNVGGALGIGISLFVIAVAAFNLLLDFDYIERSESHGAPKYMEWYFAFSLLVTLVWLYIEMIRLLTRLRSE